MWLLSSSPLLQRCPACLVRLTWIGGRWLYGCCFLGYCLQDLFNIARSILVKLPSSLLSIRLVNVHLMHPYSSIDTTAALKKLHFILSVRSDFHMADSLSIAVLAFASRVLMSFSVDEMLLRRLVKLTTSFREVPFSVEMLPRWLKDLFSVLTALTWRPTPAAPHSRLSSRVSALAGEFGRTAMSSTYSLSVIIVRGSFCLFPLPVWNRYLSFYW